MFFIMETKGCIPDIVACKNNLIWMKWQHRKKDGFVAQKRRPVADAASTTEEIREIAKELGITTFGVTPLELIFFTSRLQLMPV
jgi:hypothetical protein